jgi:hypothetical protein
MGLSVSSRVASAGTVDLQGTDGQRVLIYALIPSVVHLT